MAFILRQLLFHYLKLLCALRHITDLSIFIELPVHIQFNRIFLAILFINFFLPEMKPMFHFIFFSLLLSTQWGNWFKYPLLVQKCSRNSSWLKTEALPYR